MDFSRNTSLVINPYLVYIRSAYHNLVIPNFTKIYGSPSLIRFTSSSVYNASGILFKNSLTVIYPGLKPEDFTNFNNLLYDDYHLDITTTDIQRIRVAKEDSEMKLTTKYTIEQGFELNFKNTSTEPITYLGQDLSFPGSPAETLTQSFPYTLALTL